MNRSAAPIGIFDSGIGGLTVAHAIKEIMPNERLIYFGDTAHLPYGDKSTAAIQAYSIKITDLLISQGCKVIIIACNSASAAAYELLTEYAASKAKVINVVDPMVTLVSQQHTAHKIGVIGTRRTIATNIYKDRLHKLQPGTEVVQLATPLLVPMIEEGFVDDKIAHDIIEQYLGQKELSGIDQLILGCTHYPLIKREIQEFYDEQVTVLDSSVIIANHLNEYLAEHKLLTTSEPNGQDEFYVSDLTESFIKSAKNFFGEPVKLIQHRLWE